MAEYDVLVESDSHSTVGYAGLAVERSVRLRLMASDESAEVRVDDLRDSLDAALKGLTRDRVTTLEDGPYHPRVSPEHAVLVWVTGDADPSDHRRREAEEWLDDAEHDALAVLPPGTTNAYAILPPALALLHAVLANPEDAVYDVLATAGVVPSDQRLFLSYNHDDGAEVAHRLFDLLQRARFEVFLDVNSLTPGSRFEERIEHALVDKAFLLLVESDKAVRSAWVRREVNLARRHRLGLAAIHPANHYELMPGIGRARRHTLDDSKLVDDGKPTETGRKVLRFVRKLYDRALVRRRAAMERSFERALEFAVIPASRQAGGFAFAAHDDTYTVDLRPRPAVLADFEQLDRRADADRAILISPQTRGVPERAALEWLADRSDIAHVPETRIRSLGMRLAAGPV